MIKLVVFDWDDVITLGAKEGYIACLHEALVDLGVHLDPQEEHRRILATWSQPHREELRNLLREQPHLLDRACTLYEERFFGETYVGALRLVEGSAALLARLACSYRLAVATGAHPAVLRDRVMPRFGIPPVFAQILSTYEIAEPAHHKPHPYMVQRIMAAQGVTPEETLLVGDARSDMLMAQAAGVTPVAVLTGHLTAEAATDLGVHWIIEDVRGLEGVLRHLDLLAGAVA